MGVVDVRRRLVAAVIVQYTDRPAVRRGHLSSSCRVRYELIAAVVNALITRETVAINKTTATVTRAVSDVGMTSRRRHVPRMSARAWCFLDESWVLAVNRIADSSGVAVVSTARRCSVQHPEVLAQVFLCASQVAGERATKSGTQGFRPVPSRRSGRLPITLPLVDERPEQRARRERDAVAESETRTCEPVAEWGGSRRFRIRLPFRGRKPVASCSALLGRPDNTTAPSPTNCRRAQTGQETTSCRRTPPAPVQANSRTYPSPVRTRSPTPSTPPRPRPHLSVRSGPA